MQGSKNLGQPFHLWHRTRLNLLKFTTSLIFLLLLLVCLPNSGHTALQPPAAITGYSLEVSFDLPRGKIQGQAVIQAPPGQKLVIHSGELTLTKLTETGRKAINPGRKGKPLILVPQGPVHLTYEATFKNSDENRIDNNGLFLQEMWYPKVEGFCRFRLTATLPAGFEAVSEADRIIKEEKAGQAIFHFDFPYAIHESEGISLVASDQFVTSRTSYKGIELWTYLSEEAPFAAEYLKKAKALLEKYEGLFGPFPYRRFSIVESALRPSMAFPTYVLLGRRGLHQKDLEISPLDHEFVHQWFGCAVFTYYDQGNWSEGLTTYLSSHLQNEEKKQDWVYRRALLADFQSQVKEMQEYPLRKFLESRSASSRAIGYAKGAMVFHMLRQEVGNQAFFAALSQFFKNYQHALASWSDLQQIFERVTGRNLSWFFRQWVDEVGQPQIAIKKIEINNKNREYTVNLVLRQESQPKRLALPVTFKGPEGDRNFQVELDRRERSYSFRLNFQPEAVVVDKDYTVFRALLPAEYPPARAPSLYIGNVAPNSENITRGIQRLVNFSAN